MLNFRFADTGHDDKSEIFVIRLHHIHHSCMHVYRPTTLFGTELEVRILHCRERMVPTLSEFSGPLDNMVNRIYLYSCM